MTNAQTGSVAAKPATMFRTIMLTGLLTCTLDICAAFVYNYKTPPENILRYIASGIFGTSAFKGGAEMAFYGLLLHYLIAFSFSALIVFTYLIFFKLFRNKYVIGIIWGIISWCFMNLVIVPVSNTPKFPFNPSKALTNMVILMLFIGIPAAIMANRYWRKGADPYAV